MVNNIKYETGTYVFVNAIENSHRKILNSQFRNNINLQLLLSKTKVEVINTIFSELTNNLDPLMILQSYTTPGATLAFVNVTFE